MWVSYILSGRLTRGRLHGSAIAIFVGLVLAYFGGVATDGKRGIADIPALAGVGLMGGAMLRDFAIVATAMGVHLGELRRTGMVGVLSLFTGVFVSFFMGACVAYAFGFRCPDGEGDSADSIYLANMRTQSFVDQFVFTFTKEVQVKFSKR